jgi:hypothetical protein
MENAHGAYFDFFAIFCFLGRRMIALPPSVSLKPRLKNKTYFCRRRRAKHNAYRVAVGDEWMNGNKI